MSKGYFFIFITFVISFSYIVLRLIENRFGTLDLIIFTLFILLSMVALIGMDSHSKAGFVLSILLFAFLLNYMIFLFLEAATLTRFLLAILNVIAFVVSVFKSVSQPNQLPLAS